MRDVRENGRGDGVYRAVSFRGWERGIHDIASIPSFITEKRSPCSSLRHREGCSCVSITSIYALDTTQAPRDIDIGVDTIRLSR